MADIEFDPVHHLYKVNGNVFPSVTQIIEATVPKPWEQGAWWGWRLAKQGLRPDTKRNNAALLGTKVHLALAEYALGGVPDEFDYPVEAEGYLAGIHKFWKENGPVPSDSEVWTYSLSKGYAGTLDLACNFTKGKYANDFVRLDLKTGRVYPESHFPQLEAYEYAEVEQGKNPSSKRLILKVTPGGNYKLIECTDTFYDFEVLLLHYRSIEARKERLKK